MYGSSWGGRRFDCGVWRSQWFLIASSKVTVEIFDADLLLPSALLAIHSKGQHHLAVTRAVDVERFHEFRRSLHDPIVAANPRLTNGPAPLRPTSCSSQGSPGSNRWRSF
jgi:hypothetical protein